VPYSEITIGMNNKDYIMNNNNQSAVIVGASLCGLMTAIALAQTGMKVTVLERSGPNPRTGAVLQVNSGESDFSDTAKLLRKLASGGVRSPEAWNSIRSRLQAEIRANSNINIHFNRRAQSLGQDNTSAWVLTDKGERFAGDLVIGADGYRSKVRTAVSPDKPDATFAGYVIWVAILNEQDLPKEHRPSANAGVSMPNGIGDFLLGSVIDSETGSREPGQRRLGWAWYDNTRNKLFRELGCIDGNLVQHSLNGTDIPARTLKELNNQAAERWPQPWLAATQYSIRTRSLIGLPISEYIPDRLVNGRIGLAGDAAHTVTPITAMGFNASLQDAAMLAESINKETDVIKALLMYESSRLKPVRKMVQSGQSFSYSFGR
jgi:2-polyprenyl-6-methoxyphenol hydroxylase-like FAD-dependent oxidoreductase